MKNILLILVCFVALSTLFVGILLMSVPDGSILRLPISFLHSTVFDDFRLPGFLLFLFVGCTNLIAAFYLFINMSKRYNWSLFGGIITILWVVLQWMIIENTMLTDMIYFLVAFGIILISLQLKGRSLI
jgi:hypothetical protein